MPFFVDIFYPDNPQRRLKVENLRAECREAFIAFKTEWNLYATAFNDTLKGSSYEQKFHLTSMTYNPDNDDVETMIREINSRLKFATKNIEELRNRLGEDYPKFKDLEVSLKNGTATAKDVANIILDIGETALGGVIAFYAYNGIRLFLAIANLAGAGISDLASLLAGAFGGLILGAAAVIITDIIISAIEGAIERSELESAIGALEKFKKQVANPISKTASDIGAQANNITSGLYRLNDHLIIFKSGKKWHVFNTGEDAQQLSVVNTETNTAEHFGTPIAA